MFRRTFTGRDRRFYLVALTVSCAFVLLIFDRPRNSQGKELLLSYKEGEVNMRGVSKTQKPTTSSKLSGNNNGLVNPCTGNAWQNLTSVPDFLSSPVISIRHNLMYCPVGKVGSSYFTRLMISLGMHRDAEGRVVSPYTIPITEAGRNRCANLNTLRLPGQKLTFLQKAELLVFGRDPYRRLFSAWLDKLYSPNPFFWKHWGESAILLDKGFLQYGGHASCAADVTFQQFVRLVVHDKGLHTSDVHLRPVAEECRMCDLHYTLIGKIETTSNDLDLLASRINVTMTFHHEQSYKTAAAVDTVLDAVGGAFSWRHDILRCGISLDRMGRSIWRKLQIRGVFGSSEPYPFKPKELDQNMPAERFIAACRNAISRSTNRERLRKQKDVTLVEAYSQLTEKDLVNIQRVYSKDFLLFGYDQKPDLLFHNRNKTVATNALDWNADWVL
ncbi:carbohydrate sulfotransferase [Plakobranchus ocellatus]|uniref:Carbohydrate sulfotransferase n=1 Tax=Plakobranchus ocellatus TaxID=259542 RepID=A0AAV3ZJX0_9GAST|nr:carbohydrate sulfotransferase [Plakobranchus ocellatus]